MANNPAQYLFVYGTLRRDSHNDMYKLLARHAEFYADAWFVGKLFRVTYYPCAIPSDNQDDRVLGEVYRLNNPEFILEKLDDYEECSANYPDPKEYVREKSVVHTGAGERIDAWIYLYNRPVTGLPEIISGDFFKDNG